MTCIKTGCVAYIRPLRQWIYGDAFSHGVGTGPGAERAGVLIIRAVFQTQDPKDLAQFGNLRHFTVDGGPIQWWDESRTSMKQNSTFIAEPGWWTNHGYDGIHEPMIKREVDA